MPKVKKIKISRATGAGTAGTSAEGNTNNSAEVVSNPIDEKKVRKWVCTWNNYPKPVAPLLDSFKKISKIFVIQEEDEGTPHLQCVFEFENARCFSGLTKLFPKCHWEKCKDWPAAITYCSDELKRKGQLYTHGKVKIPVTLIDPVAINGPLPWQANLIEYIKKPRHNDRTILWIYDEIGHGGKTQVARHIAINYNGIFVQGKSADIKFAVAEQIELTGDINVVCLGLPRTCENYVSYDAIESVKDGIFFSGKYKSGQCIFNPPHMIVLANFEPDKSKLSADRWDIQTIEDIEKMQHIGDFFWVF